MSLAEDRQADENSFGRKYPRSGRGFMLGTALARKDILGRNLLERAIRKLRQLPSVSVRTIPENPSSTSLLPARSAKSSDFITAWESAVAQHVQEGATQLLLLRIGCYSDVEYEELLRFHVQRGAALTQAYGTAGALDLAVVEAECLRGCETPYRKMLSAFIPEQERFFFDGYVNPVKEPRDLRQLVEDGLAGRCSLQPVGTEISAEVWIGSGAQVDPSVRVTGPAFIGAGTRIAESCTIRGSSSIERDCEIDCGTTVDQSSVLQGLYIGVALNLQRSVVTRNKLFHLDRNVEVEIDDDRLLGTTKIAPIHRAAAFVGGDTK